MSALADLPMFCAPDLAPTTTRVESAVRAIARGEMVIVVDDLNRENEGDLVIAAEFADAAALNFMATHGRGLICISMTTERLSELEIPPMTQRNTDRHHTAFHVGVDLSSGTSTGISARDRALTARALADPNVTGDAFAMPGHLFPLAAHPDGLDFRRGHTEASVELTRLAGLAPAAVICEIASGDGEMARLPELLEFAREHQLEILPIDELARFAAGSQSIERVVSTRLPAGGADFDVVGYRDHGREQDHLALVLGDVSASDPLVYLHSECLLGDVFHSKLCACHARLEHALEAIQREGQGVVVYLRHRSDSQRESLRDRNEGLLCAARQAGEPDRAAAAAILEDLGITTVQVLTTDPAVCYALARHGIKAVATWTDGRTKPREATRENDRPQPSRSTSLNGRLMTLVSR